MDDFRLKDLRVQIDPQSGADSTGTGYVQSVSSLPIALRNYGTFVPFHLFKIYLEAVPCEKPYFCEMNGG